MLSDQYNIPKKLTLVVGLFLCACKEDKDHLLLKKADIEVSVVTVQPQKLSIVKELPGRTSPYRIAEIRPQVDGIISKRNFIEGSNVIAGQQLYQIEPARYQSLYNSAKGALALAVATLETAQLKEKRYRELLPVKAISQQDYDDARAALKEAEANALSSKADLELARINLNYARIESPISGRIGKSIVTEGALVTANQGSPLAIVQQFNPIYVDITQPMIELLSIKRQFSLDHLKSHETQDLKLKLILEDGSLYKELGILQFTDITVDTTTGSVTLRALFPNPNFELLPGAFVRVILEQGVRKDAILVPQQSIIRTAAGNTYALLVNNENIVKARNVKVGYAIGNQWVVEQGLKAGDKLIVAGMQKVKPGTAVKPIELPKYQSSTSESNFVNSSNTDLERKITSSPSNG